VQIVDVRFTDLPAPGSILDPLKELEEDTSPTVLGFDGSSIRGFQAINESGHAVAPRSGQRVR